MKKILLVIFFLQYLVAANAQSIKVNSPGSSESNYEAEQLLMNVLLDGGSCSSVSNFELKDNPARQFPNGQRSWGYFEKGNSDFPFEKGIILTSGYAIDAEGPDQGIVSMGDSSWPGDADATQLANAPTYNATVFEFDFIPNGNEISFNYLFASEEYPQFACDQMYNDVFGFIISGPGIQNDPGLSGKNIALLPNGDPVTINNVNDQGCGDSNYYVAGQYSNPFIDIEYGGRTVPLTAQATVIAGETYHIRLLVADAGDTWYDSAVFLEGGSFSLGSTLVDINGTDLGDDVVVCSEDEYTVYLSIDGDIADYEIKWYINDDLVPGENGPSLTVNFSCTVRVEVISGECAATDEVNIIFGELPTNGEIFTLQEVDEGGGFATFNLTQVQPMVVDNPDDMGFGYYEQEEDAYAEDNPILNPTAYVAADNTVVYCRVEDETGCFKVVKILLKVIDDCINPDAACPGPEFGLNIPFQDDGTIPESAPPGPNYGCLWLQPYPRFYFIKVAESGNLEFDMSQYTEPDEQGTPIDVDFIVWGPFDEVPCDYEDLQQVVDCSYSPSEFEHVSIPNALAGEYYIMMITNWAGYGAGAFGYVNLVFDEENSTGSFDCSIVSGAKDYSECDNDNSGQVQFDLATIAAEIAEGDSTVTVTFYSDEEDATEDTGINTIPTGPYTVTTATSPDVIYAQVKNVVGEVEKVIKVTLSINPGVEGAFDNYAFFCDAGLDGTEIIDLTEIPVMEDPTGHTITYYENEQSAINGDSSFIPNPTAYLASSGDIYVRIENEHGCFTIAVITIEISGLEVDLGEGFSMCEGEFTLTASGNFEGFGEVTFTWYLGGEEIQTGDDDTLVIHQPGTYKVLVETEDGCSGTDTIVITQGDAPVITGIHVGPDYVIIDAEGGITPYTYSLTGVVWQESNQFNYLQPGIHTAYVKSAEGCIVTAQFAVLDIPTMFTPNGDGINDTWNIAGLEIYPGSDVVIYDRYGRLVHEAELNSHVIWDGMMTNGKKAPTQDYWYIINITDGRKLTGHVTLKSRGEKY